MKAKLFQFAIIWNPEKKKDSDKQEKSKLLVGIETLLAEDEKSALILASRQIPEEYLDRLNQIDIALRPF